MASNSTISIGFKIENGRDGFKNLITDAESLQKVLASTVTEAQKIEKRFINFSTVAKSFSAMEDSIRQLGSVISDISGESNEFTTAMKAANTMAGKDAAGFSALKKEVTGLAKDIPLLREELRRTVFIRSYPTGLNTPDLNKGGIRQFTTEVICGT